MNSEQSAKDKDQFYTNPAIALSCARVLRTTLDALGYNNPRIIEPSAGTGALINAARDTGFNRIEGYDIEPKHPSIKYANFLELPSPKRPARNTVVFGNPPFGSRSKLAIEFFNKSAELGDTVAFIIPAQFRKWSVQSKISKGMKLVVDTILPEEAFIFMGKPYAVRCVFQIWTRRRSGFEDLRIKAAPPITHSDFEMYQYNNTPQALHVFDKDWDFAVPRQGYHDYTRREVFSMDCEKTTQWILFKAEPATRKRLSAMDFDTLALGNTTVKGFGKADVIKAYNLQYGETV